jgi:hypothetical protein
MPPFAICHWDTFDGNTFVVAEALTLEEAVRKVEEMYKGRIRSSGADKVDIVDMNGDVARSFKVG